MPATLGERHRDSVASLMPGGRLFATFYLSRRLIRDRDAFVGQNDRRLAVRCGFDEIEERLSGL